MPRPLRIEFAGARYHVMFRGNARMPVFRDDGDRELLLDRMAHFAGRFIDHMRRAVNDLRESVNARRENTQHRRLTAGTDPESRVTVLLGGLEAAEVCHGFPCLMPRHARIVCSWAKIRSRSYALGS